MYYLIVMVVVLGILSYFAYRVGSERAGDMVEKVVDKLIEEDEKKW